MRHLRQTLREHRHVFIIVTLLCLATTFPTIVYVFNTDVFWHPAGTGRDVYLKFWDVWYGRQFLSGQAAPFYTDLMFYPEGLSLAFHSFSWPHILAVNALSFILPVANAYSLAYLLIIALCALAAYAYLVWLFSDKWTALLGAIVFGFSPHVVGHPYHVEIAFIALIPLAVYCFHRGTKENRPALVIAGGLLTGLTTFVSFYTFVCLLITLGLFVLALAVSRWRDQRFWLNIALLLLATSVLSLLRVYPLLAHSDSFGQVVLWHGQEEVKTDAISFLVNHKSLLFSRLAESNPQVFSGNLVSYSSYLGILPLLLIGVGLYSSATRRMMAPWAVLCALFLILRLGSRLVVNGTVYPDILLPKHYLNQLLPVIFAPFWEADHFMMGALLPFAILVCCGLAALRKRLVIAAKPTLVVALILIVALEYHMPVQTDRVFPVGDGTIGDERFAFIDWLKREDGEIRLINLPMGRYHSKIYNLYQSLSGFPHAEGAIARTPDGAYDYIRANFLLNAWQRQRPVNCDWVDRDDYLAGLAQLEADGFSHVAYHAEFDDPGAVRDSFLETNLSYTDDFVQIYRLADLRAGCSSAKRGFAQVYVQALQRLDFVEERPAKIVVFPFTARDNDNLARNLRLFSVLDREIVAIISDERPDIQTRVFEYPDGNSNIDLKGDAALWLVNSPLTYNAEETPAFRDWFAKRFHFCQRVQGSDLVVVDLYLQASIPCSAMDESSAVDIRYDGGARLLNASYDVVEGVMRFHLAWTNAASTTYSLSLQFFDEDNRKALQYDNVIRQQLLSTHEIDISSLPAGAYSIQLIVYNSETLDSQGGTIGASGQRVTREFELAKIDWNP